MVDKKILVLSVSAGSGHTRAANAICAYASMNFKRANVVHWDVMDYVTSGLRKVYTDFYIEMVNKAPSLWGYLYNYTEKIAPNSRLERLRRFLENWNARVLRQRISDFKPDAIICTHFLPAEMLAHMIKKNILHCPVWVQVTDFDLHRMWVHQGMAGYFVANDEVAFRLQAQGVAASTIYVTGIPVMPGFGQSHDRAHLALTLGLDGHKPTFLLMSGGSGIGQLEAVAEQLLKIGGNFQLIVLAGKNAQTLGRLQVLQKQYPLQLLPCGFTDQVEQLMACADLVISKPGGLTTAECLSMRIPMIVNSLIPGQEERNANFLLECGVALKAFDSTTLAYRVRFLLAHPKKLAYMKALTAELARPLAAVHILEKVLAWVV